MKRLKIVKQVSFTMIVILMGTAWSNAQDTLTTPEVAAEVNVADAKIEAPIGDVATVEKPAEVIVGDAKLGRSYFDGSKRFLKGGPACITCHNVTNDELIPGGLLAKDLTDVYERMGEGLTAWLGAPPFPAMVSSYENHVLTEMERSSLTAFLKEANEVKAKQTVKSGANLFLVGGASGVLMIMGLIALIWMKRKKNSVKTDIFLRQTKASDAKY